jgi:dihydropteroate synthase
MQEAMIAGVDMINDITGFRDEDSLSQLRDSDCALCIMHMQGTPQTMQHDPSYDDVVREVSEFLLQRADAAASEGIDRRRLCIGKTLQHNLELLANVERIQRELSLPLLVGLSRKSMIGKLTDKPVEQRMAGSIAAALYAIAQGARIVRVHDVAETVDAISVWQAANNAEAELNAIQRS